MDFIFGVRRCQYSGNDPSFVPEPGQVHERSSCTVKGDDQNGSVPHTEVRVGAPTTVDPAIITRMVVLGR